MAEEGKSTPPPVVELRVHGVGGTTPENLLDHPRPDKIAGDDISGFYRRPDRDDLEAYSWGGLTSRSGARAGWLLLLPFALANVAGWLLYHPPGSPSWPARFQKAVVRLIAALITGVYVLWIGQVAVDIIAYQCGGQEACFVKHWWLRLFDLGFFGTPAEPNVARRLAAGMLVPLAVIALLTYLGKRSRNRYEEQFAHEVEDEDPEADPALLYGLADDPFWHSSPVVERLTRLHIAIALAAVAGAISGSLWRLERTIDGVGAWERLHLVLLLAAVALGAFLALLVGVLAWVRPWMGVWLPRVAAAFAALVGILALLREGPAVELPGEHQILPGWGRFSLAATAVLLGLVILLGVFNLFDGSRRELVKEARKQANPRAGFRGFGPFTAATFGAVFLAVVLAGATVRIADWLGDRVPEGGPVPESVVEYAAGYDWLAVIMLIFAALVAVAVAIRLLLLAFGRKTGWRLDKWRRQIDAEYAGVADDPRPEICRDVDDEPCRGRERDGLMRTIARTRRIRAALGAADGVVANIALAVILVATGVFAYRWIVTGDPIGDLPRLPDGLEPLLGPATWLAALLPILFLGLLRQAYRNPTTRRRVGILWDVITFWPRWYHPLAPPSYATRAVPQLTIRLRRLLATTRGQRQGVALSAHSQGTVVAAATVLRVHRLEHGAHERLGLVTHGSPLRRLYGRFFPAYFGNDGLLGVERVLTGAGEPARWKNLYRLTDYIGGAVFGEERFKKTEHGDPLRPEIDMLVADPITDRHAAGDPCPSMLGHSGYFSTPNSCSCPPYDEVLGAMKADLAQRVRRAAAATGPTSPTSGSPPPPPAAPPAAGPGTAGT